MIGANIRGHSYFRSVSQQAHPYMTGNVHNPRGKGAATTVDELSPPIATLQWLAVRSPKSVPSRCLCGEALLSSLASFMEEFQPRP
jgi:hypothetical protein